ncbi:MAG: methyltransferase domain-containing protein [Clostridia bacterium]|nr:methyltransferase domain-containing protein [Clostridia bacterium]
MKIPFWEKAFKNDKTFLFGSSPNKTVTEFENLFDKNGVILDIGCGDGKNAVYLARQGFENIDAFDPSEDAIEKLKRISNKEKLKINAQVKSLQEFNFEKQYDLVLSFGVYHFVPEQEWKSFILKAQQNTKRGGVHIIQMFNDSLPPTPDIAPYAVGMAKDGELKDLYKDWEILQFLSYEFEEEHPGVPLHKHASNKLVARKI